MKLEYIVAIVCAILSLLNGFLMVLCVTGSIVSDTCMWLPVSAISPLVVGITSFFLGFQDTAYENYKNQIKRRGKK